MESRLTIRRNTAGFSLIEMMAALFVLGTGLFGTVQMYQFATAKVHAMRQSQAAAWVLEETIENLRATPFDEIQSREESLEDVFGEHHRLPGAGLSLEVAAHPDPELQLKEVAATVRWRGENGRRMKKSLTTFIGPASSDRRTDIDE